MLMTAFALAFAPRTDLAAAPPTHDDLIGSTWELVSHRYGDATEWENAPANQRKLKMLTATHYVWIEHDTRSGEVRGSGGGTYTLSGATYTEVVEFGGGGVGELRGKDQVFTFDLKGDRLEQTGTLTNGFKIGEIWQRVR